MNPMNMQTWRTHSCVPRRDSSRRLASGNQKLLSVSLALLMAHPALLAAPPPANRPGSPSRISVSPAAAAAAAAAPAPGARKPVAAQVVVTLPGQSVTTLPDGQILTLGGQNAAGAVGRAALKPTSTGIAAQLAATLRKPRSYHTATILPDGLVLVLGGLDRSGLVAETELFDPAKQSFDTIPSSLQPRAYHTATLLTDGRVLIAGGIGQDGQPLNQLELWNPKTRATEPFNQRLTVARRGHTAKLQADGNVRISGGITAAGTRPGQDEVIEVGENSSQSDAELQVAASIPANEATDVTADIRMVVRFTRPLRVSTVSAVTVNLRNETGPVAAKVIAAEAGMLAFVTPDQPLSPGTLYTLSITGARDTGDFPLPNSEITFTTAAAAISTTGGSKSATKEKDDPPPPPLQAQAGVTALYGHSRTSQQGKYLPGVTLTLDCAGKTATAQTDSQGRFLLISTVAGHCELEIDGTTARDPGKEYGRFFPGVDLIAGRTNVLPYTIWMTPLDKKDVTVPSPTTRDTVITHSSLKGLELHLPPNTVIRDQKTGQVITKITLSPVPIGRPPFPLPKGVAVPFYFTIQPGGAYVEVGGSRYAPGKGAQLVYPNRGRAPAGTEFNFWDYDADGRGWYIYGKGKVDANRKSVVPDPNVVIYRFTGAMVAGDCCSSWPPTGKPKCEVMPWLPECHDPCGPDCTGDPVVPSTGLFYLEQTDLALPDVMPIALRRVYRPSYLSGPFGVGSTHPYEIYLVGTTNGYTYMDLILPDSGRVHYTRTSTGTTWLDAVLEHNTTASSYYKSVISWNGSGWDLKFKNGTVYTFPDSSGVPGGARSAISRMKDRYGNAITMTRNPGTGVLQKITSPNGRWISFTYDSDNRITQAQDNGGRTYIYQYDEGGRLVQVTDPMNGVTQYTYDANNQMLTMTEPRNIALNIPRFTNEYNSEGRVFRQTAADGGFHQFDYTEDGNGNITQTDVTNPRGFITRYTYDSNGYFSGGNAIAETRALGMPEQHVTTYQREQASNLVLNAIETPLNRTTSFTYDNKGNLLTITKAAGTSQAATTSMSYDSIFNVMNSITDPLNHTTQITIDPLTGNRTAISDPITNQTRITTTTYNTKGQLMSSTTSPMGPAQVEYQSNGDISAIIDPLGNRATFGLDSVGRVVSASDSFGNTYSFQYDGLNRLTKLTDPLQAPLQYSYDPNSNLQSITDARNGITSYVLDNKNRQSRRTDPLLAFETFQYDTNDNLIQITDRKQQITTTTYDGLDRPKMTTFFDNSTVSFTFDSGNRLTQLNDTVAGTTTYTYDLLDRLLSEASPKGTISYTYDAAGRRSTMTVAGQATVNYTYDNADRLIQITQGTSAVTITYDTANRRASLTLPNGVLVTYGYDGASRLNSLVFTKGLNSVGNLTYSYDAAGRRTQMGGSLARMGLPQAVTSANYNAANQLTQWNGANLTYDPNGNTTGDGTSTYVWDTRNRLASLAGAGLNASFQYDSAGRRLTKTINGTATGFLYDGKNVIQELAGTSPTANLLNGLGVDEVFAREDFSGATSFMADGLNSTTALLDSTGAMLTQFTYEPFGKTTTTGAPSSNTVQFTGRENDGTGLMYYRNRYYHPTFGRFISEDPLLASGNSHYIYAHNDPVSFIDPLGLTEVDFSVTTIRIPELNVKGQMAVMAGSGLFLACREGCDGKFRLTATIKMKYLVRYSSDSNLKHEMGHVATDQGFWNRHKSKFDKFEGTYDSKQACLNAMQSKVIPAGSLFNKLLMLLWLQSAPHDIKDFITTW